MKHYSYRTEKTYLEWAGRFKPYGYQTKKKNLVDCEQADIRDYLGHLALQKRASSSTQNQAFDALLFLMLNVLQVPTDDFGTKVRAKRGAKLPVVLSVAKVKAVLSGVSGTELLMVHLLYGAGLRLMELLGSAYRIWISI